MARRRRIARAVRVARLTAIIVRLVAKHNVSFVRSSINAYRKVW